MKGFTEDFPNLGLGEVGRFSNLLEVKKVKKVLSWQMMITKSFMRQKLVRLLKGRERKWKFIAALDDHLNTPLQLILHRYLEGDANIM